MLMKSDCIGIVIVLKVELGWKNLETEDFKSINKSILYRLLSIDSLCNGF